MPEFSLHPSANSGVASDGFTRDQYLSQAYTQLDFDKITPIGTSWPRSWTHLGLGLSLIGLNQSHIKSQWVLLGVGLGLGLEFNLTLPKSRLGSVGLRVCSCGNGCKGGTCSPLCSASPYSALLCSPPCSALPRHGLQIATKTATTGRL